MPITWDQIPLEMRQAVVSEMDVGLRCSKSDYKLVRSTKNGKVKSIKLEKLMCIISYSRGCENQDDKIVTVTPRDGIGSIWKITSLIGTTITADSFEIKHGLLVKYFFTWFRENIRLIPKIVKIELGYDYENFYDESIFDWPSNTNIDLGINSRLPDFNRCKGFDRIVSFDTLTQITDETLKKLANAKRVGLQYTHLTMNGFDWWIRKWIAQKDDQEEYKFRMLLTLGSQYTEFSFENIS